MLVVFKSAPILKRALKVKQAMMQLYVLKLLKVQTKYLGRQWRKSNMKTMSAIYQKVRHRLNDDWAYGNGEPPSNPEVPSCRFCSIRMGSPGGTWRNCQACVCGPPGSSLCLLSPFPGIVTRLSDLSSFLSPLQLPWFWSLKCSQLLMASLPIVPFPPISASDFALVIFIKPRSGGGISLSKILFDF